MITQDDKDKIASSDHPIDMEYSKVPIGILVGTRRQDIKCLPVRYEVVRLVIMNSEDIKKEIMSGRYTWMKIYRMGGSGIDKEYDEGDMMRMKQKYREDEEKELLAKLKEKYEE